MSGTVCPNCHCEHWWDGGRCHSCGADNASHPDSVSAARAYLESEGVDVDAAVDRVLRACAEKASANGTPMHPSLKRSLH